MRSYLGHVHTYGSTVLKLNTDLGIITQTMLLRSRAINSMKDFHHLSPRKQTGRRVCFIITERMEVYLGTVLGYVRVLKQSHFDCSSERNLGENQVQFECRISVVLHCIPRRDETWH